MAASATWPDGAEAWVKDALAPSVLHVATPRVAPRSWSVALEDGARRWYFKEDRSPGPCEAAVLAQLALRHPAAIAPVVATDERRGWNLTADAGPILRAQDPTDVWCRAVRRLGMLQVAESEHLASWRALGCRDLTGGRLPQAIEHLLTAATPELAEEDSAALAALAPRIAAACATLEDDALPDSLVHRDVVLENIARSPHGPVLLDWSDVVVGHPFFACDRLLDACWADVPRKEAIIAAYLHAFEGIAEPEVLRSSFDAVLFLRVIYEGVRWMDEIAGLDQSNEHRQRLWADALAGLRTMAGTATR